MKKIRPSKPKAHLQEPTFQAQEEHFLARRENFFTGLWSALRIFFEYMHGFYVFRNIHNCITIFGSARFTETHKYYQMAHTLGYLLAKNRYTVMTGGGPGIMEAANRGAKEGGGRSISCNINLALESPNLFVDKKITFHYFFVRKVMLTKYSSAFIVLPGGLGTLDELFEMSTLIQTHKVKNFPLILMGSDYWSPLINFMRDTLLKSGTIFPEDIERLLVTDSPDDALAYINRTP